MATRGSASSAPAHSARPRIRRTPARTVGVLLTGCAVLAGTLSACTAVVDGHATVRTPTDGPTTHGTSSSPDFTGQPSTSPSPTITPTGLRSRLMPAPAGSRTATGTWPALAYPTINQFVAEYYRADSQATVAANLREEGLTTITHRVWIARNGTQADVLLFGFATAAGAQERYTEAATNQANTAGVVRVPVTGAAHPASGYRQTKPDSDDYVTGVVYSVSGPVVAEIFSYTPKGKFDSASTLSWARTQIAALS